VQVPSRSFGVAVAGFAPPHAMRLCDKNKFPPKSRQNPQTKTNPSPTILSILHPNNRLEGGKIIYHTYFRTLHPK
jgi:hypothetical protein